MRVDFAGKTVKAVVQRKNAGFSFIDALAACFLLTVGLVVVAGALNELALADSVTDAKVYARTIAASVMAELQGLPAEEICQYSPEASSRATVVVELVDTAGKTVALPAQSLDVGTFPPNIEVHIKVSCKSVRGHVVTVQAIGYINRWGV